MPKPIIWAGTEASYEVLANYEEKYQFDKSAFLPVIDIDDLDYQIDPTFGQPADRIGLTILEKVGDVAVIKVHGSLTPKFARWHYWFPGEVTSYAAIKDALHICAESKKSGIIDSVLMDFATGGGAVVGLDIVTETMKRVGAVVTINGHTDTNSFSAGYWIMAGCRKVTASRMSELGSIGVLAIISTLANTEENFGRKFHVLREGEFKALGNPYEELTESARAYLQKNLFDTNMFFLEHVSINRNVMLSDKAIWAEGKTFFAQQAVQVGLVDQVLSLDDLIGSGASANNTGDSRSYAMKISAEKLAQIAAGADPKVVLTAEELVQYENDLKAAGGGEQEEEVVEGEEEQPEAEANLQAPVVVASEGVAKELRDALRDNGKLEAKLEAQAETIKTLEAQLTSVKAESNSLLVVAQAAVSNLQVATQSPKESKNSAAEVLAQFNELSGKMAKLFKPGQNSADTPVDDSTVVSSEASDFRFQPKPTR